jgi:GTP-binding protein HflX
MPNLKHEKVILIDVVDPRTDKIEALKRMEELESLVGTFGGVVIVKTFQKRAIPDYTTYIGSGKAMEIAEIAAQEKADVLIVNNILKPRQIYNLEEFFRKQKHEIKIWSRIDLILKIFGKHAQSTEAKLQIELAAIKQIGPRIFGLGIELSRQAGAVGLRAGQGESNTELMKRHLHEQELNILQKLKKYDQVRQVHRENRRRNNLKTVALVGYTNAGKSSLLHALTGKSVYIADKLFATLDTRVGKLYLPPDGKDFTSYGKEILVSDTIGFIQDLPPSLIKAFKSTLTETIEADLILHVIDVSDPQIQMKITVVEEILEQLGAAKTPQIYVFNKVDLLESSETSTDENTEDENSQNLIAPEKLANLYQDRFPVFVSAAAKIGLEELKKKIEEKLK